MIWLILGFLPILIAIAVMIWVDPVASMIVGGVVAVSCFMALSIAYGLSEIGLS